MTDHPILAQGSTLNPYVSALRMLTSRLRWDLKAESRRSRVKLRQARDRYAGRKAVILCNGPSLLHTDFDRLAASDALVFGLNKINILFDKVTMRPDVIVAVNPHVIEQNAAFFNATDIPLYLDASALANVGSRRNITYLHSTNINRFARDCSISINQGYTVTFVALQLTFHLGFTEVALVGCDHNFTQKGPANMAVTAGAKDPDHFDPNYFPAGVKWQLPDLAQSEASYFLAREAFEAAGRRIVNCTVGGQLEVYPRLGLDSFLR